MAEHYTRGEVGRIIGLEQRQLRYWESLRLVRPRARWGERFYSFSDLVALAAIKDLTANRVPARRLRRAVAALAQQLGEAQVSLAELRLVANGRQVAVIPPNPPRRPFEPLTGQWLLSFEEQTAAGKIQKMVSRTAEEWFEFALSCDGQPEMLSEAAAAYRRVIELEPAWVEAHINLGVALYHLCELDDARRAFEAAVELDPHNATSHFNLGCVFDEVGELDLAIKHLRWAVRAMPAHADAHFNLALVYEKRGQKRRARDHWSFYLRYEPHSPWADYARSRMRQCATPARPSAPIPFRRRV